jgi:hypothetical protein
MMINKDKHEFPRDAANAQHRAMARACVARFCRWSGSSENFTSGALLSRFPRRPIS